MALTSIGIQKTPGRPTEVTFAAQGGLPNPNQIVNLIGHMGPVSGAAVSGASSGTAVPYTVVTMSNVADPTAGANEANAKFGAGSELAKMVIACINANASIGASNFPQIVCTPLVQTDAGFGPANGAGIPAALAAAERVESEFLVSPYDGSNTVLSGQIITAATLMSGATRVQNNQFGTFAVIANQSVADPATLPKYDTQFVAPAYLRDSAPTLSIAELAAGYAGTMGGNAVPFNPLDGIQIGSVPAPANLSDYLTVGAGLDSEAVLNRGWAPLRVLPNGSVVIVRSVTARLTTDGTTEATAYYDVQDFQVLYFLRKAIVSRFNQADFQQVKASSGEGTLARGEVIAILSLFEDQGMVQAVELLSPQVVIERNVSDRSRFDIFIPTNVVPGLHVIASNIQATTQFDVFTA